MPQYSIDQMRPVHLDQVVRIHLIAFPGFFLSFLGPAFLFQLYSGIIDDPSGIAFIYEEKGSMRGFIAGTAQPSHFYKRLLRRRGWAFALASVRTAIRNPRAIPRLVRALRKSKDAEMPDGCGTLMSIAVLPGHQGDGIGGKLVNAFLQEARQRGLRLIELTTDRDQNDEVNQFYQHLGFELYQVLTTPEGRAMNEYMIAL